MIKFPISFSIKHFMFYSRTLKTYSMHFKILIHLNYIAISKRIYATINEHLIKSKCILISYFNNKIYITSICFGSFNVPYVFILLLFHCCLINQVYLLKLHHFISNVNIIKFCKNYLVLKVVTWMMKMMCCLSVSW